MSISECHTAGVSKHVVAAVIRSKNLESQREVRPSAADVSFLQVAAGGDGSASDSGEEPIFAYVSATGILTPAKAALTPAPRSSSKKSRRVSSSASIYSPL